jgi:hypothetical protein
VSRPRELSEARITRIDLNLEPGAISAGVIARFDFVCGPTLVRGARLQRHGISKELTVFLPKTRFKDETIRFTCDAARVRRERESGGMEGRRRWLTSPPR